MIAIKSTLVAQAVNQLLGLPPRPALVKLARNAGSFLMVDTEELRQLEQFLSKDTSAWHPIMVK